MNTRRQRDEYNVFWSNDRVYSEFPVEHLARKYLIRFYEVRKEVCGRDIDWPDRPKLDQEWESKLLGRQFSFSAFAYCFVSLTLTMDEWFDPRFVDAPSNWEIQCISQFAMKNKLLDECAEAATQRGNVPILRHIDMVRELLRTGIDAVACRINIAPERLLSKWGREPEGAAQAWLEVNAPGKIARQ